MKEPVLTPPALDSRSVAPANAVGEQFEPGHEGMSSLPRDHPAWQRDVLAVSARARELLARLRPVTVRVLTFWDHVLRAIVVGGRRVEVDPSGSYRMR
ncbi:MAG TPA: hypothetical protein VK669_01655 [Candidatus Limnocylindrales bacterium]|nr:hypothetical protein [Candidatus Limnocylindrales bacterium]